MATRPVKKPGTKRASPIAHSRGGEDIHTKSDNSLNHEQAQLSRYGVYAYIRKADNHLMYIGKDSTIHESNRKSAHENPKNKEAQVVNKELQRDIDAYTYEVVAICGNQEWMEDTEVALIGAYKAMGMCEWNILNELPQEVLDDKTRT